MIHECSQNEDVLKQSAETIKTWKLTPSLQGYKKAIDICITIHNNNTDWTFYKKKEIVWAYLCLDLQYDISIFSTSAE